MNSPRKNLAAAAILAALTFGAIAQSTPQTPPSARADDATVHAHRGGGRHMDPGEMQARMAERMQRRLDRFKQHLKITPAQEGAWTNWTQAMRPAANMQRPNRGEMSRLPTPERIDRMRAQRAQRMAEMDRRGEATKAFYGQLSAEQKKMFDEAPMRMGRGGRGDHGDHHRGGPRGGPRGHHG